MHIYFGRINENQEPKNQLQNAYYAAKKGSTYFGTLNQFDDFSTESVYVFMLSTNAVELWKVREWGNNGDNLYFDKTNVNLHEITRAWVAAFKYFFLDPDLIVFTTRRPFKKAFFELKFDPALTEAMLLDHKIYEPDSNFRHIEVHDSMPASSTRNVVLYKDGATWGFKEPEFYDTQLTQHFRDNMSYIGKGRTNKDSILKTVKNANPLPAVFNPDQLTLLDIYDVFFCAYNSNEKKSDSAKDDSDDDEDDVDFLAEPHLNTIFYGPPGTGKTYKTIIRAAQIIAGEKQEYEDAKKTYDALLGDQIEFITFHQNYSYEDFVLGLRPDVKSDELKFKRHEGVFYKISKRAKDNYSAWKEGKDATEPAFERVLYEFLKPLQTAVSVTVPLLGNNSFSIHGSSTNFLEYTEGSKQESLNLDTLKDIYRGVVSDSTDGKHTYYTAVANQLRALAERLRNETEKAELKQYVLIIDEINRANISRVFGELITLIEKDKRLGNSHEMKVTLSNGDQFSVPKNLYIIGTMNTADKSIALIDVALRRRFVFEPMYPKPSNVINEYREFFIALNQMILEKKNADFLIGHSYLMEEDGEELDFASALNHKIIPLLNEYFYNNRSVKVHALLSQVISHVPGYNIVEDPFTGAICQRT